jgi:hypothetical protein
MELYTEVKHKAEALYAKAGLKVVVEGYSGGTIGAYAFLMHMTLEWRQKYVLARCSFSDRICLPRCNKARVVIQACWWGPILAMRVTQYHASRASTL